MKKLMAIAAAALLPLMGLRADYTCRVLTPDPDALAESIAGGDDDDPYHRSGSHTGETRLDVVDVLVAYDKSAQAWLADNHRGTIDEFAAECIEKANYCLSQSDISEFRFRLAGTVAVDVDASGMDIGDFLGTKLVDGYGKNLAQGELKKIPEARTACGADIVSVLVDKGTLGEVGIGYSCISTNPAEVPSFSKWAYNVCSIGAVDEGYTMVHEIGHNMGCGHPDEAIANPKYVEPGPQSYSYSAGNYFWQGGVGYHTIMAYNSSGINEAGTGYYTGLFTSLPMFSSPELVYEGHSVGDATHDNRRVLLQNYKYVAQYMVSKVVDSRTAMSIPDYQSEFMYDGEVKQSLESVGEGVEVEGTWWAVESGRYTYTLTLSDTSAYRWADGTDAPITVTWKIKDAQAEPDLFDGEPSTPFAGGVNYNGWVRGDDNTLQGTVTVKSAKARRDGTSKLTVVYTPFGQRKQTLKTVAAVGGNPVVAIPGIGSVKLGGESLQGVDVNLEAAPDLSKNAASKAAYLAALSAKVGTWTFAFDTDQGYAAFSVTVDKKGKGKLTGTLPDGTKVSVSAQGALGDNGLAIPFAFAKKGSVGFVFWVKHDGTAEISDVTKLKTASSTLTVKSWTPPSSANALADGACTFVCGTTVENFTVAGKKWTFAKDDTKLKLSFNKKTAIVKGNFRVDRTKYTVNGVVVGSQFYGSAFVKGQTPLAAWTK